MSRPACPRNLIEEAFDTSNGVLVRRCFRLVNAKALGLTITLADITEQELRVMEVIETGAKRRPRRKSKIQRAFRSF